MNDIQEAIEHIDDILSKEEKWIDCKKCKREHVQLKEWLKELQRYRAAGTFEELAKLNTRLTEYSLIGTTDECRKAMGKQIRIKPQQTRIEHMLDDMARCTVCPDCSRITYTNKVELPKYCVNCGQAFEWREEQGAVLFNKTRSNIEMED